MVPPDKRSSRGGAAAVASPISYNVATPTSLNTTRRTTRSLTRRNKVFNVETADPKSITDGHNQQIAGDVVDGSSPTDEIRQESQENTPVDKMNINNVISAGHEQTHSMPYRKRKFKLFSVCEEQPPSDSVAVANTDGAASVAENTKLPAGDVENPDVVGGVFATPSSVEINGNCSSTGNAGTAIEGANKLKVRKSFADRLDSTLPPKKKLLAFLQHYQQSSSLSVSVSSNGAVMNLNPSASSVVADLSNASAITTNVAPIDVADYQVKSEKLYDSGLSGAIKSDFSQPECDGVADGEVSSTMLPTTSSTVCAMSTQSAANPATSYVNFHGINTVIMPSNASVITNDNLPSTSSIMPNFSHPWALGAPTTVLASSNCLAQPAAPTFFSFGGKLYSLATAISSTSSTGAPSSSSGFFALSSSCSFAGNQSTAPVHNNSNSEAHVDSSGVSTLSRPTTTESPSVPAAAPTEADDTTTSLTDILGNHISRLIRRKSDAYSASNTKTALSSSATLFETKLEPNFARFSMPLQMRPTTTAASLQNDVAGNNNSLMRNRTFSESSSSSSSLLPAPSTMILSPGLQSDDIAKALMSSKFMFTSTAGTKSFCMPPPLSTNTSSSCSSVHASRNCETAGGNIVVVKRTTQQFKNENPTDNSSTASNAKSVTVTRMPIRNGGMLASSLMPGLPQQQSATTRTVHHFPQSSSSTNTLHAKPTTCIVSGGGGGSSGSGCYLENHSENRLLPSSSCSWSPKPAAQPQQQSTTANTKPQCSMQWQGKRFRLSISGDNASGSLVRVHHDPRGGPLRFIIQRGQDGVSFTGEKRVVKASGTAFPQLLPALSSVHVRSNSTSSSITNGAALQYGASNNGLTNNSPSFGCTPATVPASSLPKKQRKSMPNQSSSQSSSSPARAESSSTTSGSGISVDLCGGGGGGGGSASSATSVDGAGNSGARCCTPKSALSPLHDDVEMREMDTVDGSAATHSSPSSVTAPVFPPGLKSQPLAVTSSISSGGNCIKRIAPEDDDADDDDDIMIIADGRLTATTADSRTRSVAFDNGSLLSSGNKRSRVDSTTAPTTSSYTVHHQPISSSSTATTSSAQCIVNVKCAMQVIASNSEPFSSVIRSGVRSVGGDAARDRCGNNSAATITCGNASPSSPSKKNELSTAIEPPISLRCSTFDAFCTTNKPVVFPQAIAKASESSHHEKWRCSASLLDAVPSAGAGGRNNMLMVDESSYSGRQRRRGLWYQTSSTRGATAVKLVNHGRYAPKQQHVVLGPSNKSSSSSSSNVRLLERSTSDSTATNVTAKQKSPTLPPTTSRRSSTLSLFNKQQEATLRAPVTSGTSASPVTLVLPPPGGSLLGQSTLACAESNFIDQLLQMRAKPPVTTAPALSPSATTAVSINARKTPVPAAHSQHSRSGTSSVGTVFSAPLNSTSLQMLLPLLGNIKHSASSAITTTQLSAADFAVLTSSSNQQQSLNFVMLSKPVTTTVVPSLPRTVSIANGPAAGQRMTVFPSAAGANSVSQPTTAVSGNNTVCRTTATGHLPNGALMPSNLTASSSASSFANDRLLADIAHEVMKAKAAKQAAAASSSSSSSTSSYTIFDNSSSVHALPGDDERHVCGFCGRVFPPSQRGQYRTHMQLHTLEEIAASKKASTSSTSNANSSAVYGGSSQPQTTREFPLVRTNSNANGAASGAGLPATNFSVAGSSSSGNPASPTANSANPRPYQCVDCCTGFRIPGHLQKHLRCKMHILKLECAGRLPNGLYEELERRGMTAKLQACVDTSDCESAFESLRKLADVLQVGRTDGSSPSVASLEAAFNISFT